MPFFPAFTGLFFCVWAHERTNKLAHTLNIAHIAFKRFVCRLDITIQLMQNYCFPYLFIDYNNNIAKKKKKKKKKWEKQEEEANERRKKNRLSTNQICWAQILSSHLPSICIRLPICIFHRLSFHFIWLSTCSFMCNAKCYVCNCELLSSITFSFSTLFFFFFSSSKYVEAHAHTFLRNQISNAQFNLQ